MKFKILVNGYEVNHLIPQALINEVRVIVEGTNTGDDGAIVDVIDHNEAPDDVIATSSIMYNELVEGMLERQDRHEVHGYVWTPFSEEIRKQPPPTVFEF